MNILSAQKVAIIELKVQNTVVFTQTPWKNLANLLITWVQHQYVRFVINLISMLWDQKRWICSSLVSLGGLLALLLLFLLITSTSTGLLLLVVSELFNQESSHNILADLWSGKNTTVGSGDCALGRSHSSEIVWPGDLNSLHTSSLGVFLNKMKNKFSSWNAKPSIR